MNRVLVTGGTSGLGREVVYKLLKSGYTVRVMSRQSQEASQWPEVEWIQADLATGVGLHEAVANVHTIIHAATDAGVTLEAVSSVFCIYRFPEKPPERFVKVDLPALPGSGELLPGLNGYSAIQPKKCTDQKLAQPYQRSKGALYEKFSFC